MAGIILGTPVYFGDMSSLCKAFLERWHLFRKTFALANKVGGAIAVGAGRNGGQEHTLRSVQVAMMGQQMIVVGDGKGDVLGAPVAPVQAAGRISKKLTSTP